MKETFFKKNKSKMYLFKNKNYSFIFNMQKSASVSKDNHLTLFNQIVSFELWNPAIHIRKSLKKVSKRKWSDSPFGKSTRRSMWKLEKRVNAGGKNIYRTVVRWPQREARKAWRTRVIGKGREEGYSKGRLVRTSVIPWMLEVEWLDFRKAD